MNYHTCFMCQEYIEYTPDVLGPINHFKNDHNMQFSITKKSFVFSSLELFDEIYHNNKFIFKNYIIMYEDSGIICYNNKPIHTLDNIYWRNFKELKAIIDKVLVFS